MEKSTKNIILIILMILMIIAAYFTINKINLYFPRIDFNDQEITNNSEEEKDTITTEEEGSSTTSINSNQNDTSNNRKRPSRDNKNTRSNDNNKNRQYNRNFNNIRPQMKEKNNTIYIILFGLESMIFGICGLYLFLLNTNKLKEDKKSLIDKLKTK